jgi:hypothetical protein
LEGLNPHWLKLLAQLACKSSAQALTRAPAERHYPILVAFLCQSLVDVTDEVIEMFDRCISRCQCASRTPRAGLNIEKLSYGATY